MAETEDAEGDGGENVHGNSAERGNIRTDEERRLEISPHGEFSLAQRQFFSVCGPMVLAGASGAALAEAGGSSAMPSFAAKSARA